MNPEGYLVLSAILFAIGVAGFLLRRNAIIAWRSPTTTATSTASSRPSS